MVWQVGNDGTTKAREPALPKQAIDSIVSFNQPPRSLDFPAQVLPTLPDLEGSHR